jgi:hypothetical protein
MEALAASVISLVSPFLAKGAEEFAKEAGKEAFAPVKALVERLALWWKGDADWRAVDPYLQRLLIYHLLAAGPDGNLPAKLAAVLDWGFLAARLATWNDAGHLGADLRAVAEVLERSRPDGRSSLWPLRVRGP